MSLAPYAGTEQWHVLDSAAGPVLGSAGLRAAGLHAAGLAAALRGGVLAPLWFALDAKLQ